MGIISKSSAVLPRGHSNQLWAECLDHLVPDRHAEHGRRKFLPSYLTKVARLGGYLARASDPPPGNIVRWRGLSRFTDIELGFGMAQLVGNRKVTNGAERSSPA